MTLHDLIVQSASAAIGQMDPATGRMQAGHNGPYHDPETPVRTTSHWMVTFVAAYRISGDRSFLEAGRRAAMFLCSEEARPHGKTFYHRLNPRKDRCNGLVGQAWTIEALLESYETLDRPELRDLAQEVFELHVLEPALGVWHPVEIDGTVLDLDMTFNHQLWFAASAALMAHHGCNRAGTELDRFMECVDDRLTIARSGLIEHALTMPSSLLQRGRQKVDRLRRSASRKRADFLRAVGYHAFNLYAFAMIYPHRPMHAFWRTGKFRKLLLYVDSAEYHAHISASKYGFPYNPPGFEVAMALETFKDMQSSGRRDWWVNEQLRQCYDGAAHLMSRNTEDPVTHASRVYEATRLPDMPLSF